MRFLLLAMSVILMASLLPSMAQAVPFTIFEDNFNDETPGTDLPPLATVGTWRAAVANDPGLRGGRIDAPLYGSDGNVLLYHPGVNGKVILGEFTQPAVTGNALHAEWDQYLNEYYIDSMLVRTVVDNELANIIAWTREGETTVSHLQNGPLVIPKAGFETWVHFEWDYIVGSDILTLTLDGGTPNDMPFDWGWTGVGGNLVSSGASVTQIEALQWRSFSSEGNNAIGRIDNVLVTVDLLPPVPPWRGDLNNDGIVDAADENVLKAAWGTSFASSTWEVNRLLGDPSNDGFVGVDDVEWVRKQFGLTGGGTPAAGAAVPEPGSLALLAMGSFMLLVLRRRSRVC